MKKITTSSWYVAGGALLILGFGSHASAQALAELWQNVPGSATAALIANQPNTAPDAEFLTNSIDYNSLSSGYTAGSYFLNPTFFDTSANFAVDTGLYGPDASLDNSYAIFTGETPLVAGANVFQMTHDDGFELSIPSLSFDYVSVPGACCSGFDEFTVTAPSGGNYSFVLSYGEAYGAPADLAFAIDGAIVSGVPEPGTFAMLGSVCLLCLLSRFVTKQIRVEAALSRKAGCKKPGLLT